MKAAGQVCLDTFVTQPSAAHELLAQGRLMDGRLDLWAAYAPRGRLAAFISRTPRACGCVERRGFFLRYTHLSCTRLGVMNTARGLRRHVGHVAMAKR